MKISKLIKELQKIQKEHGDIPATIFTYDGEGETESVNWSLSENENTVVTEITFCDQSWVDAFAE